MDINVDKFNIDMVEFVNDNNIMSSTDYLLTTNLNNKYTYVFKKLGSVWNLIYKWSCTVGKPSTPTIKGIFYIIDRKPYFEGDYYRVKYATRIFNAYYYHSIIYNQTGEYVIEGRLGQALSHGCIRLATENATWIYENIPNKTTVIIG